VDRVRVWNEKNKGVSRDWRCPKVCRFRDLKDRYPACGWLRRYGRRDIDR
jgi:hypothetical protein